MRSSDDRSRRESLMLGAVAGAVVSIIAAIILALTIDTGGEGDSGQSIAVNVTETGASVGSGEQQITNRGGRPEGRGPGAGDSQIPSPFVAGRADDDVIEVFASAGCLACHSIKGVGGEGATVGPHLYRTGELAATRRPGPSAEAYITESILDPNAFIMPNCPTGSCSEGLMPETYRESLAQEELTTIVDYLSALGTADEATVLNP